MVTLAARLVELLGGRQEHRVRAKKNGLERPARCSHSEVKTPRVVHVERREEGLGRVDARRGKKRHRRAPEERLDL
jgi:hypothetical protein